MARPSVAAAGAAREERTGLGASGLGRLSLPATLRAHAGPAAFLALALLFPLVGLWTGDPTPPGADSWGHLFRAEYLAEQMHVEGVMAYVTTGWMPSWYMGDPLRTYYPPMTTIVLTPFVYLIQDPFLAYRIFLSLVLVAFGALTYAFLAARAGPWPAALGASLAVLAPYQLRTAFYEGNAPRTLALLALPPIFHFTERMAAKGVRYAPGIVGLSMAWAWAFLCHPQQAVMFALGVALFVVARLFLDPDIPFSWAVRAALGILAGLSLSAPWWLPAYSGAEVIGVPFLPAEKVELFVAHLNGLIPKLDLTDGTIPIGVGLLALALLAALTRPKAERSAYLIAGLLTAWLALGGKGVLFNLLPFRQQLLPERFLNFTSFALAMAASGIVPFHRTARLGRAIIVVGMLTIDASPGIALSTYRLPSAEASRLATESGAADGYGRSALLVSPEPNSVEVYYASKAGDTIFGWGLENTPHHPLLRRVLDAPEWSPAYLERLFALWDVSRATVRGDPANLAAAEHALTADGFAASGSADDYRFFRRTEGVSPVRAVPSKQVLVVGRSPVPMLAAYPFAQESSMEDLNRLSDLDLQAYPVLALTRFETSLAHLEADQDRLTAYVERGGVVVTDLSGMEDFFGRTANLMGVNVLRLSTQGDLRLRWSDPALDLPDSIATSLVAPEGWSGAVYDGLDVVLAEVQYGNDWWPVLGYRQVGAGRVWFLGMNLLYYAQLTGETRLEQAIRDWTLEGVDVWRDPDLPPLPVSLWEANGHGLSLEVDVGDTDREVLISYTYTPRWRILVDGQPTPFSEYEHLIRAHLPAGRHAVTVTYDPYGTAWPVFGLAVGLLTIAGLAIAVEIEWRRFIPAAAAARAPQPEASREFAPCANCGFRLAEVGPPTSITYPFQVVHCPICGMRMDDEGFVPGDALDASGKTSRLDQWLRQHNYNPAIVHEKWGFDADQFFAEGPEPPASREESEGGPT